MSLVAMTPEECFPGHASQLTTAVFLQTLGVTVVMACAFVLTKTTYDRMRRRWSQVVVVVIGAGPIGLTAALIAAHSKKASRVIVYEDKARNELLCRPQQIAMDAKSVNLLRSLGVDFDNLEGCWKHKNFFTRIGVFQEYILSFFHLLQTPVELKLKTKFTKESLKDLEAINERLVVVVCDGSSGRSASLLGLSDEFIQHSCKAYGAVAALERHDQPSVPTPEIKVHNLTFDLNAYGSDCENDPYPQGFHLKIFGSARHRYISLAVPRGDSKLVRTLKGVLDQSVMRNVFQACFNTYKQDNEAPLSDKAIIKHMKFSPRLFEIKLSHRMESVAYIEDANLFVVTEGESARCVNFHSGMDINLALRGVQSLETFIRLAASAESEKALLAALNFKFAHVKAVTHDFLKNGLKDYIYT